MLIVASFIFAALGAALAPDTRYGARLRTLMIETPARVLSTLTPKRAVVLSLVALAATVLVFGAPELVMVVGVGDLALMLDITIAAMLASATDRIRAAMKSAPMALSTLVRRGRRPAARAPASRPRRSEPTTDEEDHSWGRSLNFSLAA